MPSGPLGRLVVISPHCDDAVFACGQLLAAHPGSVVVTVFAGRPPAHRDPTEWDRAAGFRPGDDVVGRRRDEDRAALACLRAAPVWLDFCDSQYRQDRRSPSPDELAAALEGVALRTDPAAVFMPLGLFHSDHELVHEAGLLLMRRRPERSWFAYEDAMYRRIPGLLAARLARLQAAGLDPTRATFPVRSDPAAKARAVQCYRSQLRALSTPGRPGFADALEPEGYWRLARPRRP